MALPVPEDVVVPAVSAFVRVRPLIESEQGSSELPGLQLTSAGSHSSKATAFNDGSMCISGFSGVVGQEAPNRDVFERCLAPKLQTVLRGGTTSLFCYGYTGSGKTHTAIGYGEERGLFFLAAEHLLQQLARSASQGGNEGRLFLQATACEMYNDEVFDLMGSEKVPCTLRVDGQGKLNVLGPQTSVPLDDSESGHIHAFLPPEDRHIVSEFLSPSHATLITRSKGLRSVSVFEPDDLQEISRSCVTKRAVGSSTEHTQSSRSHAILRVEVVNNAVLDAQAKLEEALALVPPRKNAVDNMASGKFKLFYSGYRRVLTRPTGEDHVQVVSLDGNYAVAEGGNYPKGVYVIEGHESEGAQSLSFWAEHFDVPDLVVGYMLEERSSEDPSKWELIKQAIDTKERELKLLLEEANAEVKRATDLLAALKRHGPEPLGGALLLVDLAGADYDHRSGAQQKESAAINKSLLSLKECLRSLAGASGARPKFRDSKLTRLLEDFLAPATSSGRLNRTSVSVMIVNVSSAEHLGKMTMNTLRYGQMFAESQATSRGASTRTLLQKPAAHVVSKPKGKHCVAQAEGDLKIHKELLALYRVHCPEKSAREVLAIICRFAGREAELLQKAREKYASVTN